MSTTPIPSSLAEDLLFNAQKLDEAITSAAYTYTDRFGVARRTVAGAINSMTAFTYRGAWVTATAYAVKDQVLSGGITYVCVVAHTSGATFAGDLASRWQVFQGVTTAQLADTTIAANNSGLVGFKRTLNYAVDTIGWGVRANEGSYSIFNHILPSEWANILNGTSTTDLSTSVQAAHDAVLARGGGELWFPGLVTCNTPVKIYDGVNVSTPARNVAGIRKDSTTTKACTIYAGSTTVYGALPTNLNACLILDGPGGRYTGRIRGMRLEGTYATPGNYETQKVEFGIVSTGSVSDALIDGCNLTAFQWGMLFPVIFTSELRNNRMNECLKGITVDNGTSLFLSTNYGNNCRDWSLRLRDVKYGWARSNASDHLNDPAKYPTRTRTCAAYRLESMIGFDFVGNGDEYTYGRSVQMDDFRGTLSRHTSISMGSDYAGSEHIAWLYSTNISRQAVIENNFAYDVKGTGLLSGGAVALAAQHHNIYFEGTTFVDELTFRNNKFTANRNSNVEAGWGNNVPTTWINMARGDGLMRTHTPTLEAQTPGNFSVSYGSDNRHYIEERGQWRHVWGCFHVTPTHSTASGLLIINGFPTNGARMAAVEVVGVSGGSGLTAKLGWFEFSSASTGGVARSDGDVNFVVGDLPSGTQVRIFYDGWYSTV